MDVQGRSIGRRAVGVAAGGMLAVLLSAGGAAAQDGGDYVGNPPPNVSVPGDVDAGTDDRDPRSGGVDDAAAERDSRGGLALTGTDILGLAAVGAAAVATGSAFRWRSRRGRRDLRAHPA